MNSPSSIISLGSIISCKDSIVNRRLALSIVLAFALLQPLPSQAMHGEDPKAAFSAFESGDHFAADPGGLYTGVKDPKLRALLNRAVAAAAASLDRAKASGASDAQMLAILRQRLFSIDREALDTEDAERVASIFEQLLETTGLESSGGAIDEWMYGFSPG